MEVQRLSVYVCLEADTAECQAHMPRIAEYSGRTGASFMATTVGGGHLIGTGTMEIYCESNGSEGDSLQFYCCIAQFD